MFPDAVDEIAAASRCLALDEWTTCVFHAMRVLERALRRFAAELNIPMSIAYEENWSNIIDMIEKEIRVAQNAQRSPTTAETLRFYSDAVVNLDISKPHGVTMCHIHRNFTQNYKAALSMTACASPFKSWQSTRSRRSDYLPNGLLLPLQKGDSSSITSNRARLGAVQLPRR